MSSLLLQIKKKESNINPIKKFLEHLKKSIKLIFFYSGENNIDWN